MTLVLQQICTCPSQQASEARRGTSGDLLLALPVLVGLFVLYLPIYQDLASGLWRHPEYGHGPLIAVISCFLLWRQRAALSLLASPSLSWLGTLLFAVGLLLAWVGQTQGIALFATASQIPVIGGLLLVLYGRQCLPHVAFPVLFLLFMVPIPGALISDLTLDLKEAISAATVEFLHSAGYPIARSGVIVVIGQYQMLVADACSGLHSLFSLAALGVLYIHLRPQRHWIGNVLMVAAIVPVGLLANLLRTVALMLLTFHGGDAMARTFHDATGILLFLAALLLLSVTWQGISAFLTPRTRS